MTNTVVESALRATYHLAGVDATRLRRLTQQSGLDAENVLSRLAIVRSISAGRNGPHADYRPSQAGRTKEIKGSVLLGRPRQAALVLALLLRDQDHEFIEPRSKLTWHWARGLRLLEDDAADGDVLRNLAEQLAARPPTPSASLDRRARRAGLGSSLRDELAAAVGRRFPRWPTEVRRLVAMAARLDPAQLDTVASRLAADAAALDPDAALSETLALRVVREQWGLNRLGLSASDRDCLAQIIAGDPVSVDHPAVPFLTALGLTTTTQTAVRLSSMGRKLGQEAIHP